MGGVGRAFPPQRQSFNAWNLATCGPCDRAVEAKQIIANEGYAGLFGRELSAEQIGSERSMPTLGKIGTRKAWTAWAFSTHQWLSASMLIFQGMFVRPSKTKHCHESRCPADVNDVHTFRMFFAQCVLRTWTEDTDFDQRGPGRSVYCWSCTESHESTCLKQPAGPEQCLVQEWITSWKTLRLHCFQR